MTKGTLDNKNVLYINYQDNTAARYHAISLNYWITITCCLHTGAMFNIFKIMT